MNEPLGKLENIDIKITKGLDPKAEQRMKKLLLSCPMSQKINNGTASSVENQKILENRVHDLIDSFLVIGIDQSDLEESDWLPARVLSHVSYSEFSRNTNPYSLIFASFF